MDSATLACIANLTNLNLPEWIQLCETWDGSEGRLRTIFHEWDKESRNFGQIIKEAQDVVKTCHKNQIHILWPGHKYYPSGFYTLDDAPIFLTFQGELSLLADQARISVVGSREPMMWVQQWMEQELGAVVEEKGLQVISGGARGVDQLAHQIAIRHRAKTISVLPSGLLAKYPKNIARYDKFIDMGLWGFLSEYNPKVCMRKFHFYKRNRLISAMSNILLVMQANSKSGSMITARFAIEQGKEVCTIPGAPGDPSMHGNLQLLFDGAQMVRWGADLHTLV